LSGTSMTELSHRFPPPWDIDHNGACFIVRDANGQALKRSALLPSADQRWCLMNKVCIVDLFDKKVRHVGARDEAGAPVARID
jgi:hypothetical protein